MGSYVSGTMIKGEEIIHEAKISWWAQTPLIVFGIIGIFFYGLGIILLLIAYLQYKTTELAITNKRVIAKFGFISRRTVEISLAKVESIQVQQPLLGRIFNYGSLVISGAGNPQAPVPGIADPMNFRQIAMQALDDVAK